MDVFRFHLFSESVVDPSDGDKVGVLKNILRGRKLCRVEPYHRNTTALSIATIPHLLQ